MRSCANIRLVTSVTPKPRKCITYGLERYKVRSSTLATSSVCALNVTITFIADWTRSFKSPSRMRHKSRQQHWRDSSEGFHLPRVWMRSVPFVHHRPPKSPMRELSVPDRCGEVARCVLSVVSLVPTVSSSALMVRSSNVGSVAERCVGILACSFARTSAQRTPGNRNNHIAPPSTCLSKGITKNRRLGKRVTDKHLRGRNPLTLF